MGKYRAMAKRMGLHPKGAKKVATVQTVKRMMSKHTEGKTHSIMNISHTGGNTWTVFVLSNMAQGASCVQRIGNKISPTYLKYRLDMAVHNSNTLGEIVRVVIFADKEARGVLPDVERLALSNTANGARDIPIDPVNQTNRYKILSDKVYNMTTDNNFQAKTGAIKLKSSIKFGTDDDDYQENSIFMAIWTYDNVNKSTVNARTRLYFKDA